MNTCSQADGPSASNGVSGSAGRSDIDELLMTITVGVRPPVFLLKG